MRRQRLLVPVLALLVTATALLFSFLDSIVAARVRATLDQSLEGTGTTADFDNLSLTVFSSSPRARLQTLQLRHQTKPDQSDISQLQAVIDSASFDTSWRALLSGSLRLEHVDVDGVRIVLTLPRHTDITDTDTTAGSIGSAADADAPEPGSTSQEVPLEHQSRQRTTQQPARPLRQRIEHTHEQLRTQLARWPGWLSTASVAPVQVQIRRDASAESLLDATGSFTVRAESDARLADLTLTGFAQPDTLNWPALSEDGSFSLSGEARLDDGSSLATHLKLVTGQHTLGAETQARLTPDWTDSQASAELSVTDGHGTALRVSIDQHGNELSLHIPEMPRHRSDMTIKATIDTESDYPSITGNLVSSALHPEEIFDVLQPWLPVAMTDAASASDSKKPGDTDRTAPARKPRP